MSSIPPRLSHQDKAPTPNGTNGKNSNQPKRPSFFNQFLSTLLIFFILVSAYTLIVSQKDDMEQISLSQLASDVAAGRIESIEVSGQDITATYQNDIKRTSHTESSASLSETLVNYGVTPDELRGVDIDIKSPSGFSYWFFNLAPFLIPILFIGFFVWFLSRQVKGAGMQAFTFGQSRARFIDPNDKAHRVTFKDVAGVKEAKQELVEIVDFLKNPKKFLDLGARIPKGVILMGAPGTGKTLLARAVAGEANVPFFSISGSEFVEMFVGVGASRVRDLFKVAKKAAPAIIFVDEIDAVGRTRGGGVGGGNDEREQTLNQILVEMDGFEPNEKVIVMAATNRPDVLDPALLRPGRFDRRVVIDTPDIEDREEILKIQTEQKPKKPLADNVDFRRIAERTPGFSGADLYSLVNEAAIITAREDRKQVTQDDFINAIEKVMLGPERRSHLLSKREREITAYHEAGHALVASVLEHSHPVHKISIVSRGRAAGYTLHLPLEEKRFRSRKEFLDDLAVTLAGYVTELMVFDDVTTGPSNDLQVATARARDMVTKYGMSDEIGPIALESDTGRALYGKGIGDSEYSERIAAQIDAEVSRIIHTAQERARAVLVEHREFLNAIAKHLVEKETIEREEFENMLRAHNIHVKTLDEDADEPSLFIGPEPPEPTTEDGDTNL